MRVCSPRLRCIDLGGSTGCVGRNARHGLFTSRPFVTAGRSGAALGAQCHANLLPTLPPSSPAARSELSVTVAISRRRSGRSARDARTAWRRPRSAYISPVLSMWQPGRAASGRRRWLRQTRPSRRPVFGAVSCPPISLLIAHGRVNDGAPLSGVVICTPTSRLIAHEFRAARPPAQDDAFVRRCRCSLPTPPYSLPAAALRWPAPLAGPVAVASIRRRIDDTDPGPARRDAESCISSASRRHRRRVSPTTRAGRRRRTRRSPRPSCGPGGWRRPCCAARPWAGSARRRPR